jgi:hypothetical protein
MYRDGACVVFTCVYVYIYLIINILCPLKKLIFNFYNFFLPKCKKNRKNLKS